VFALEGSPYNDTLIGTNGDDFFIGGGDADILRGGLGNDTYELNAFTTIQGPARAAGSRIQDTNGTSDTVNLGKITLSLSPLAPGQAGLARLGNTLLIEGLVIIDAPNFF
jgi:Ca2+-binding RTX toxin-like protein